jgi:hypothetical protein
MSQVTNRSEIHNETAKVSKIKEGIMQRALIAI